MNKIRPVHLFVISIPLLFLLRIWFMLNANLLVEEAYYWNYSNHLDFSFLDHPPMVALLIKLGTLIFNVNEWGVRFATIPCWILTSYFSLKLTSLIRKEAGWYAVLLLSMLPFFFIHSLIITPDIPLILSWSATLYYLYKAIVLVNAKSWYWAGIWIGIGLLSKYTIVLLGLSTLFYLVWDKDSRKWFYRREPYCCALIAFILFTPVIYWNATHHWVSFLFQSSRRFHDSFSFSLHKLIGLVLVFLTPTGILGAGILFSKHSAKKLISVKTNYFFQIYTLIPLVFFSLFSIFHGIKINWIGPTFLAIIPWLSLLIFDNQKIIGMTFHKGWTITCFILLFIYGSLIYYIELDQPGKNSHPLFAKIMHWDNLTAAIYTIAQQLESTSDSVPVIVPLDKYNIASEFAFYQQKQINQKKINTAYKVVGAHVFDLNSLMYRYWGNIDEVRGKILILISPKIYAFSYPKIDKSIESLSDIKTVGYYNESSRKPLIIYYKIVKMPL